ncbi:DUF3833 family protein [Methylibium sp.]|uniref:DUF3833 family protein n=1 Tax=Methylibium sp. TaxID=2067992 RepID=UPI003D0CA319
MDRRTRLHTLSTATLWVPAARPGARLQGSGRPHHLQAAGCDGVLDEDFTASDGTKPQRAWPLKKFDDWMSLMDDRVMSNKAVMSEFGIRLSEVTLAFHRR